MVKNSFLGRAVRNSNVTSRGTMARRETGRYEVTTVAGEQVRAFVPYPLPPSRPPLVIDGALAERVSAAEQALSRLELAGEMVPSLDWFIYAFVRKEAVLSSQIEGTQATLMDLMSFEASGDESPPNADVEEVCNYLDALYFARAQLADPSGLPLSMRLLSEAHQRLLQGARGASKMPGEVRRSQNWIGGTRPGNAAFVPPPVEQVMECMGKLELFLHDQPEPTPALLKAALAHVQFETIHPFLDGNGRLGRLLITLLLCEQKVLQEPMLYLSLYFKTHRQYYYELLNNVRLTGDWEAWLDFFAEAVIVTATQAVETAQQLVDLANKDRDKISSLGRAAPSALQIHRALMERPITTSGWLVEKTGITPATVNKCLVHLERLGIVRELTSRKRNRLFSYTGYVDIMNQGTELPG